MSYNPNPDWADVNLIDAFEKAICPECKQDGLIDETADEIWGPGYYGPRRIPPYILFQCDNEGCDRYEDTFQLDLQVKVFAKGEVSDYVC